MSEHTPLTEAEVESLAEWLYERERKAYPGLPTFSWAQYERGWVRGKRNECIGLARDLLAHAAILAPILAAAVVGSRTALTASPWTRPTTTTTMRKRTEDV